MTFKQAFTEWAAIPQNTALAAAHRNATNLVLLKAHGNDDVRQFTAFYTRKLMQDSELPQPMKVQAASILVHVLTYAAGKEACVKPDFDFSIAGERPAKDATTPSAQPEAASDVLGGEAQKVQAPEPPSEGRKHGSGRPRVPVLQVDPTNGNIVAEFDGMIKASMSAGVNRTGVANAIKRRQKCKGYYWFTADTKKSEIKLFIASKLAKKGRKEKSTKQNKSRSANEAVGGLENGRGSVTPQATTEAPTTRASLSSFSDEELKNELISRGWKGTLYKHLIF